MKPKTKAEGANALSYYGLGGSTSRFDSHHYLCALHFIS